MWRELADDRFEAWLLDEVVRAKARVAELRVRHPTAPELELARRLIGEKRKWAAAGGFAGGLFGLGSLPAELALVRWLQLSLIVDVAVLFGRNVKSARAREEMLDILQQGITASRTAAGSSRTAAGRLAERLLASRGTRTLGRALPVLSSPITAAVNARDLQLVGEEAVRRYQAVPRAVLELRARR